MIPEKLRVSIGTAAVMGLAQCRLDVKPTTAYLMTYTDGSCTANCAFCPQARESPTRKSLLSRVIWPAFPTERVLEGLRRPANGAFMRACIQVVNYPGFLDDVSALVEAVRGAAGLPVSLDAPPLGRRWMERLRDAGLDRVGIPLDAATPEIFDRVKGRLAGGPYRWEGHLRALEMAVEVFGPGRVMSNLIVGLGETEEETVSLIQRLMDMGIQTVLFAFTPIPGTMFASRPQPPLDVYRRVQLARRLITRGLTRFEEMEFDETGRDRKSTR
ncbi:MAG: radical SAM protein, partial [Candidatus Bathyarchaeota archaeon]|nr:radical SAM protein [Candidatus Bathyarchaeota archaeon]